MYRNKFLYPVALALLTALILNACRPIISSALEPIHEVVFDAQGQWFTGPEAIPAGVVKFTFKNHEQTVQKVQIFKLDDGKSFYDFETAPTSGYILPWAKSYGGPNATASGQSSSVVMTLEPGNYVLSCEPFDLVENSLPTKGMMKALTVTDSTVRAVEPNSDLSLNLTDAGASLFGSLVSGAHIIRVENLGRQTHQALLIKLNDGKVPTALVATYLPKVTPTTLPGLIIGGVSDILPGAHQYLVVDLDPGNYFVTNVNIPLSNYQNERGYRFTIR